MEAGDHLRALKNGVWEHAIDCGDRTVFRFTGGNGAPPEVRRTPFAEFEEGAERVEVVAHPERAYPPPMVVARAFSRIREAALVHMFADSEQFALWCKTGQVPQAARNAAVEVPRAGPAAAPAPSAPAARAGGAAPAAGHAKAPARKAPARPAQRKGAKRGAGGAARPKRKAGRAAPAARRRKRAIPSPRARPRRAGRKRR